MKITLNILVLIVLMTACADRDKHGKILDTNTAGTITITVDESLKPLIDAEIDTFEATYKSAHINVIYTSESHAIHALLNDSARMAIVTRKLTEEEQSVLKNQKLIGKELKMARGAVALIINRQNMDTVIRLDDFKRILTGEINNWKMLNKAASPAPLVVVFDQPNSGIIRFLKDSIVHFDSLPSYCYAVNGNAAVIDYVSKNPQSMGLIDVSWISDSDDSTANSFLNSIKVMSISDGGESYQPYQAYIAQQQYPLLRDIIIISREARMGLGTGFTAFVASDKGQRIVLKSGIVPATMPIRIVEVHNEPFRP